MSKELMRGTLHLMDTISGMADQNSKREAEMVKAVRETGYFFFAGEKVYFVDARTGRLTNGEPLPATT